jgi:methylmalonyl-CoA mutase, N-terminal domain
MVIRDEAKNRWQKEQVDPTLKRFPERKEQFETSSGIPVERLYLAPPIPTPPTKKSWAFPGEYPFTRGVQPTMYRGRFWTMRQYAGFATAAESNERYKYLLAQGQTGLSVAFDLPTQIGYDADDPMALGEVGKVGVSIPSLDDMAILLDGIPLNKVSISMTINAPAAILLAMVIAIGKRQGVPMNNCAARSRTTFSRSTLRGAPTSSRRAPRCG